MYLKESTQEDHIQIQFEFPFCIRLKTQFQLKCDRIDYIQT